MAISGNAYGNFVAGQFGSTAARRVDWPGDTVKASLHTSSYTPNQDTNTYYTDLSAELTTGNGYTSGGVTVTSKTVTYDAATNEVRLDCDDPSWTGLLATFRLIVFRKDTGTGSTSPLLFYVDLGADEALGVATNWSLVIPATGIFKDTVA